MILIVQISLGSIEVGRLPIKSFLVREGKMHEIAATKTILLILKPGADGKVSLIKQDM